MSSFSDVISQVFKNLVTGPIGAQDMNAGELIVQQPDKHYGRDEDEDLYREDKALAKDVVPQHYVGEYGNVEVLFKAGPPAMVIKASDELRDDITDREIVVGGYASPQVIDREKHLIQKDAMAKDLPRFLANPMFANAMILHSNVQVGEVLPEWQHPETGKVYKTQVDEIGLFCIIKIRTDKFRPKIIDKVIEDIEKENLKAFSISGDAPLDSRRHECSDGECFWVIPSIEFYEITLCEEGVNQDAKLMVLSKACPDGKCGLIQKQPVPEGELDEQPEPTPQAAMPAPENTPGFIEADADATKEELSERVGEVASVVGEKDAVEMVEHAAEAAEKLENVAGTGLGSGGSGDANLMGDFGKPYSRNTAVVKGDPSIDRFFQTYRTFLARGASPEDAYFKLLEDGADGEPAPPWFGTRDGKFRQFLIQAYHADLPIPTIKLRMQGNKEGEIVADPELMAWDLLQTAVNRTRGTLDKDVSPVAHEEHEDGKRQPFQPSGLIDTRGMPQEEPYLGEAEESEEYYLNLALKALNKHKDKQGSTEHHKVPPIKRKEKYRQGAAFARPHKEEEYHWEPRVNPIAPKPRPRRDMSKPPAPLKGGKVGKHKDKQGSTAHHKTGQAQGGVAQPPRPQWGVDPMEDRLKTLTAEVKERNLKGANLTLSPGHRNAPYAVTGLDAIGRPLRLVGNVEEITQALRDNSAEVDELIAQGAQVNNYAVPVDVGKVNELEIFEGDGVSPMEVIREQVARASFDGAMAKVLKANQATGVGRRDYLMDEAQQREPKNVGVQGGVRTPGNRNLDTQDGHATTEIVQDGDVEHIGGIKGNIGTEPMEQAPEGHGIAQQGAVSPPRGIQGEGSDPEVIQVHEDEKGVMEDNQGAGLDPRADADNRGAPVAHRSRRP